MTLSLEKRYPFILALVVCIGWLIWGYDVELKPALSVVKVHELFPENKDAIFSASLTMGAILSGFLATSQSILMGVKGALAQGLRSSGYIKDLTIYLSHGVLSSLLFAFVSLLGLFACHFVIKLSWIFLATFSICAFWRVTKITLQVLEYND